MIGSKRSIPLVVIAAAITFSPAPAFAYIDPGTAGFLLQILLGGVGGAIVIANLYWRKITTAAKRIVAIGKSPPPTNARE